MPARQGKALSQQGLSPNMAPKTPHPHHSPHAEGWGSASSDTHTSVGPARPRPAPRCRSPRARGLASPPLGTAKGGKEKWATGAIAQEDNRTQRTTNPLKTPPKHRGSRDFMAEPSPKRLSRTGRARPGGVGGHPAATSAAPHLSRSLDLSASWLSPSACGCSLRARGERFRTGEGTQMMAWAEQGP